MERPQLYRRIAGIVALCGRVQPALMYLNISKNTFAQFKQDPELIRLIRRAKAKFELRAAKCISDAARDNPKIALALMKARKPNQYAGKVMKIEGLVEIPTTVIQGPDLALIVGKKLEK